MGSFLIWIHHLKNITFHDSFHPTDAEDSVSYNNGLFSIACKTPFPTDLGVYDDSVHLWSWCPVV
jgi:hypothetical protein